MLVVSHTFLVWCGDIIPPSHFAYLNESNLYSDSLQLDFIIDHVKLVLLESTKHMYYWFRLYFVYSEYDCTHLSNT